MHVLILGGRSEIGLEVAVLLARGHTVTLAARQGEMATPVQRILDAGADRVEAVFFDADDVARHQDFVADVEARFGPIDVAVCAFGILGDQRRAESDPAEVVRILHTDFVAQASVLTALASVMRRRRQGTLVAFSSVAGVRVRPANYVYGSAKAGLDGFAQGLMASLEGSGVSLVIARPGFVIGSMTEGMTPAPFSSTPRRVAQAVAKAIRRGGSQDVWIPWPLRVMFSVAHLVPRPVWQRLPR